MPRFVEISATRSALRNPTAQRMTYIWKKSLNYERLTTHTIMHLGLCLSFALAVASAVPAAADMINFDAQAATQGGNLTGIPDSPLTIDIATFAGGELLNAEVGLPVDQTGVYATEGIFGSGETNPLVITFASPVNDFSVFVANGDSSQSYTVSDNLGESITETLPSAGALGAATFALRGSGITTVSVESANAETWSFAIDNVSFTTPTSVPEPQALLLVGLGSMLVGYGCRKQIAAGLCKKVCD
jgi:hypothetical protein